MLLPISRRPIRLDAGAVTKTVECEHCFATFQYEMARYVEIVDENEKDARIKLREQLANEFKAVLCPKCGLYQSYMVEKLIRGYRSWMKTAALVGMCVATLSGAFCVMNEFNDRDFSPILRMITAAGCIVGLSSAVTLLAVRQIGKGRFDPNHGSLEQKLRFAEGTSILVDGNPVTQVDTAVAGAEPVTDDDASLSQGLSLLQKIAIAAVFLVGGLVTQLMKENPKQKEQDHQQQKQREDVSRQVRQSLNEDAELDDTTRKLFGIKGEH